MGEEEDYTTKTTTTAMSYPPSMTMGGIMTTSLSVTSTSWGYAPSAEAEAESPRGGGDVASFAAQLTTTMEEDGTNRTIVRPRDLGERRVTACP